MSRPRTQTGYVYRRAGWWVLRYRESLLESGQLVRRQLAKRIEPIAPEHRRLKHPPPQVIDAAKKILEPLNNHSYTPEATQTLEEFFEHVYLPNLAEAGRRPSTLNSYRRHWQSQLRARVGSCRLREFKASDAQRVLNEIARQSREQNHELKRNTLRRIKSLLSGMFTHAIQQNLLYPPINPIGPAAIPSRHDPSRPEKCSRCGGPPEGEETHACSVEQVRSMLLYLPEPARSMVAVAAYAGLRRSEIAGLLWETTTAVRSG